MDYYAAIIVFRSVRSCSKGKGGKKQYAKLNTKCASVHTKEKRLEGRKPKKTSVVFLLGK